MRIYFILITALFLAISQSAKAVSDYVAAANSLDIEEDAAMQIALDQPYNPVNPDDLADQEDAQRAMAGVQRNISSEDPNLPAAHSEASREMTATATSPAVSGGSAPQGWTNFQINNSPGEKAQSRSLASMDEDVRQKKVRNFGRLLGLFSLFAIMAAGIWGWAQISRRPM